MQIDHPQRASFSVIKRHVLPSRGCVAHNACCVCARSDAKSEMRNIGTEPITAELRKREARSVLKLNDVWRERRAVQIERDIKERVS